MKREVIAFYIGILLMGAFLLGYSRILINEHRFVMDFGDNPVFWAILTIEILLLCVVLLYAARGIVNFVITILNKILPKRRVDGNDNRCN